MKTSGFDWMINLTGQPARCTEMKKMKIWIGIYSAFIQYPSAAQ